MGKTEYMQEFLQNILKSAEMKTIIFFHLLNNYSGSPRVLNEIVSYLGSTGKYNIKICSSSGNGFLSSLEKQFKYFNNGYGWNRKKIVLAIRLFKAQIVMFMVMLRNLVNADVVYINTILPFAPAIAAWLFRKQVIYHIHEVYNNPNILHKICMLTCRLTERKVICVSSFVFDNLPKGLNKQIIHNSVSREIYDYINENGTMPLLKKYLAKKIIMLSSLKTYKGVNEFVQLAAEMPKFNFVLILSANKDDLDKFLFESKIPRNVVTVLSPSSVSEYIASASIIISLTLPKQCIEAFGLTLIEAFCCSTPVIAPKYGGPLEIVDDGINGKLVDPSNLSQVREAIMAIMKNKNTYYEYSENAFLASHKYRPAVMVSEIDSAMKELLFES